MADKVKEVATEEAVMIRDLAKEAAKSGAYLYPVQGILYFLSHRSLWRPLARKIIPTFTLGLGVTAFMFAFTYVPQMAVMAFTSGPIAAITAAVLVLSESSTIANILAKTLIIEDALIDTFDGTLVSRECTTLVSDGREIKSGSDPMAKLGKLIKKPFAKFTPKALVRYLMYLPLNFIPIVGTAIFIVVQGKKAGPERHARYFQLKEMNNSSKKEFVEARRGAYTRYVLCIQLQTMRLTCETRYLTIVLRLASVSSLTSLK